MDVKRLEYFCAIVEHGQISRAARALHISQPPLSQRLKELEEELGVRLLHRRGGALEVTPEGAELYKRAKYILSYMNNTRDDIKTAAERISGTVRLGVCSPCQAFVYKQIPAVNRSFPNINFRFWIMDHLSLERHMQENNLDIALVLLPVQYENYKFRHLPARQYAAVYGAGFAAPDKATVSVRDLDGVPLVIGKRVGTGGSYNSIVRAFQEGESKLNIRLETQDSGVLVRLLELGLPGVYVLPEGEAELPDVAHFAKRMLDIPDLTRIPALITLESVPLSRAAEAVLDLLLERLGNTETGAEASP